MSVFGTSFLVTDYMTLRNLREMVYFWLSVWGDEVSNGGGWLHGARSVHLDPHLRSRRNREQTGSGHGL